MNKLRAFWIRLFNTLRGMPGDDFADELEAHLAMDIEQGVREGLSREEARRRALIRFGGIAQAHDAYGERRGLPGLESMLRDLRYSVRTLARNRLVTAVAILSIGLGIGSNTTIFSLVSRFVLRPAPVGDPGTLLSLHIMHDNDRCCNQFPWPVFSDVRAQANVFSDAAAYYDLLPASIGGGAEPERVWGQGVTPNFFQVAELPMVLGTGFSDSDDKTPVVVLSERLWRRRFNSDKGIAGKTVALSGHSFTVTGIAPADFHSIDQIINAEFWVPLGMTPQLAASLPPHDSREYHWLSVIGRVRPGVSRKDVTAQLNTIADRLGASYPATDKGNHFVFEQAGSLPPFIRSTTLLFLSALSIVVLLLLAIAGFNVANLLFAQALNRQREMAVRLALGATRGRLLRLVLLESLLLGLGGGALGVLLSLWSTAALSSLRLPAPIPLNLHVNIDGRTLAYTFVLSVLCGLLLGLAPAWAAARPRVAHALKGEAGFAAAGRWFSARNVLVVAQVAMALVLLAVTGLFLRSLESASEISLGFRTQGLMLLSVDPRLNGYSPAKISAFLAQLRERAAALPGVDAAVTTDVALLSGGNRSDGFTISGHSAKGDPSTLADLYMVTPGYFDALGTPMLAGSDFSRETANGPRVAVVNKVFADRLFGGANPIGQRIEGGSWTYRIIGVVGNAKSRTLGEDTRPILYRSLDQSITDDPSMMGYTLIVHTRGDPKGLAAALRHEVYRLDPAMAVYNLETMEEHVRAAYVLPHVAATLFGVFGAIGLVLATVGLYGVMSFAVTRRTREIGIRMAMGAQPAAVLRLVLRRGMALTFTALALGWPAAWMLAKVASSFLYGISPHDAVTFTLVPIALALVALVAAWIPARRAAGINPTQALRME
ncbi:MAG TPA: ABC transporter permease [Acidobacteriaceae bacterium]|nr:ABC transporter permease [Acidobacteriaceae bacterium]